MRKSISMRRITLPSLRVACWVSMFVFTALIGYSYHEPVTTRVQTHAGGYFAIAIHRGALSVRYSYTGDRLFTTDEFRVSIGYDEETPYRVIDFDFLEYDFGWSIFGIALKQGVSFTSELSDSDFVITHVARWHIIRRFRVSLWLPLSLVVLIMFMLWRGAYQRRRSLRLGLCLNCQYDLRGSSGPQCPECGSTR